MSSFLLPAGLTSLPKKRARCGNRASVNSADLCDNGAIVSQGQPAVTSASPGTQVRRPGASKLSNHSQEAVKTLGVPSTVVLPLFSLQHYGEERYAESIAACRAALELRPDYAEAWNNICAAYNKLGRYRKQSRPARRRCAKTGSAIGAQQSAIRSHDDEGVRQIAWLLPQ